MEIEMNKLIQKYAADPSIKNAKALIVYLEKHSMAMTMASAEDSRLIRKANSQVLHDGAVLFGRPSVFVTGF
jgi:hypothetical protein